jgi:hypothetical protein
MPVHDGPLDNILFKKTTSMINLVDLFTRKVPNDGYVYVLSTILAVLDDDPLGVYTCPSQPPRADGSLLNAHSIFRMAGG